MGRIFMQTDLFAFVLSKLRPQDKSVLLKFNFLISQPKHVLWVRLIEMVLLSTQNIRLNK